MMKRAYKRKSIPDGTAETPKTPKNESEFVLIFTDFLYANRK